ncbi:D-threo-aldose 1-dehydrogenase [Microbacterium sp. SLBN-154]|uniref:aldo/keto reductase n=1 Tax=Microbacterium sp. SLBN-154 TaxID=2768458 RepID=UPI00114F6B53|nr:aldo/keto reductase [Microbacterium sp. SLBN-154]TQK17731.1 D-threo-aldose 1-dehydrogenase [Microbacterium sp. SLBN-154]
MTTEFGPLGFGAASIGNLYRVVSDETAHAAMEAAWEGGIRYFDTAPHYGLGLSERRLGAFLRGKPREQYLLSTKVGRLLKPNPAFSGGRDLKAHFHVPDDLVRRFDPTLPGVRRSLEDSFERMGIDRIDIAYLHDPDVYDLDKGLREGLPALAALRDEGLVDAIGVGVNDAGVAARAIAEGDLDVVMVAGRYTLLEQVAAAELLPLAAERSVRIVAAAPFNSGLLANPDPAWGATYNYAEASAAVLDRAAALAQTCAEFGVELPTAALQFPLRHPAVATVVVGTANPRSVTQNATRAAEFIPDELWVTLSARGLIHDPIVGEPTFRAK